MFDNKDTIPTTEPVKTSKNIIVYINVHLSTTHTDSDLRLKQLHLH